MVSHPQIAQSVEVLDVPAANDRCTQQTARKSTEDIDNAPRKLAMFTIPATKPFASSTKGSRSGNNEFSRKTEGYFEISAPYIQEHWGDYVEPESMYLRMSPSRRTGRHLWMSFNFGAVSGVMRAPPTQANVPCNFEWRGRESGEGQMTFADENIGSVTFLSGERIEGKISGSFLGEDVEFFGRRIAKANVVWSKSVQQWKRIFRSINWNSYQGAAAARWGKWMSDDGCNADPAASDTSVGGGAYDSDLYDEGDEDSDAMFDETEAAGLL